MNAYCRQTIFDIYLWNISTDSLLQLANMHSITINSLTKKAIWQPEITDNVKNI